jgi:hypothetical protein
MRSAAFGRSAVALAMAGSLLSPLGGVKSAATKCP